MRFEDSALNPARIGAIDLNNLDLAGMAAYDSNGADTHSLGFGLARASLDLKRESGFRR
jgi:hypothetical protein